MPHVYILECSDGSFYTGSTFVLERAPPSINAGKGPTTPGSAAQCSWCGPRSS